MLTKELFSICTFYAISPIHAGSGAATSTVDLPIQRERHTNWPHIQASGVKGAMRDHYRKFVKGEDKYLTNLIFGIDENNDGDVINKDGEIIKDKDNEKLKSLAGAISISDAKLLAFPMRSNIAPFIWVTCSSILKRLKNDLEFAGFNPLENVPPLNNEEAVVINGNGQLSGDIRDIILEDAVVTIKSANSVPKLPSGFPKTERLLLISDEMFDYCVSSCTEIQTQIKIDSSTGTAQDGALRYQELLPSDTLMYSIVYYSKSAELNELQATTIQGHIEDVIKDFIQIGGDETLGRGICKITWPKSGKGMGGAK
ncbi:MAG: type III-B CRISPR module RAMP protein Cmr4 [Deltaproteobacteria bacterium CG12_big_fil_rev_8_21_14_0_65_43_10]|nr:MAG: type III-B CRISPR module RAMP protein Cmr4 [Deltaproteobacteria bacterium CG2_30_43_15]PIQ46154.1 MAG: type III-B CRISPR module RAMP protein Cmr4 [Deltaproteobacteria bacterium CG12_big_fil_rev_8_21_14_0_65_43_10]PIU86754.1 MAG: type III-B CRISPR module RAMP protein Cmr4 [Deltaproteobacteria bacterium CG06_land_8_20_14_3_00_44_19]PIX22448.1 MAG: type III-B CRISPR module RAMP protein Cmr4 [Deltaproteobacteria bacterium CG_4_8_14_3_um_filter_43_13]PIZ20901.1 MAG: type III-B CRISPR module 